MRDWCITDCTLKDWCMGHLSETCNSPGKLLEIYNREPKPCWGITHLSSTSLQYEPIMHFSWKGNALLCESFVWLLPLWWPIMSRISTPDLGTPAPQSVNALSLAFICSSNEATIFGLPAPRFGCTDWVIIDSVSGDTNGAGSQGKVPFAHKMK